VLKAIWPGVLRAYRQSLEILQRLAEHDLSNAEWQLDLALALWRIAPIGQGGRT
jgi:hypothetical protein